MCLVEGTLRIVVLPGDAAEPARELGDLAPVAQLLIEPLRLAPIARTAAEIDERVGGVAQAGEQFGPLAWFAGLEHVERRLVVRYRFAVCIHASGALAGQ